MLNLLRWKYWEHLDKQKLRKELKLKYEQISAQAARFLKLHPLFLWLSALVATNTLTYSIYREKTKMRQRPKQVAAAQVQEQKKDLVYLISERLQLPEYKNLSAIAEKFPKAKKYVSHVKAATKKSKEIWPVDAVLFLSLLRKESVFDRWALSSRGAAGLAQFEPITADLIAKEKGQGWKVFLPDYYFRARELNRRAASYKKAAYEHLEALELEQAQRKMALSKRYAIEARALFKKYNLELLDKVKDKNEAELIHIHWPLSESLAVFEGTEYLAKLLKERDGDVREALSAYNGGPGTVKRAKGIPYIKETVRYQNNVINFWKYWSEKAK